MSGPGKATSSSGRGHQARRSVSRRGDSAEVEADRAASIVARGGSVRNWSFSAVPTADTTVHREEGGGGKGDEDKKKKDHNRKEIEEAAKTTGKAILKTEPAKKMIKELEEQPIVKKAKDIVSSTPGKISLGVAAAGAAAASLATDTPIPDALLPSFPIPGLPPSIKAEGRVYIRGRSSFGIGISGTFGHAPKSTWKRPAGSRVESPEARRAEVNAQLMQSIQRGRDSDAWARAWIAQEFARRHVLVPVAPGPAPEPGTAGAEDTSEQPKKEKEEGTPVQREAVEGSSGRDGGAVALEGGSGLDGDSVQAHVDDALGSTGRPLERSTRSYMESRFGVDFSGVRLHDDSRAARAADGLGARAFTVDRHVVLDGRVDLDGPAGRRLLAHELAHVVQQSRAEPGTMPLQRLGAGDWIGVLLGISEGNWSDEELRDYLELVTTTDVIEGRFHSDNKARAIVRRWAQGTTEYALSVRQKVLLIEEMLHGPTLAEDEKAIVDLLVLSPAGQLADLLGAGGVDLRRVESDVDGEAETRRLRGWLEASFVGGRAAVLSGTVEVAAAGFESLSAGGLDAAAAPSRVQVPSEVVDAMAEAWTRSFPGDRSREQGGLWVRTREGETEWIPATSTTSGSTTLPWDEVPEGATPLVAAHTHPYDETEGGHLGVTFSAGDLANLVTQAVSVKVVHAGDRLFAVAKTTRFEELVAEAEDTTALADEMRELFSDTLDGASGSFPDRVREAAMAVCADYGLLLYEGSVNGEIVRVELD